MSSIISYLLLYNQYLLKQIYQLTLFIAKYIPIKQWSFDDSHSPKYQKFKTNKHPIIKKFIKQDYNFLLEYYLWKYGKPVKPVWSSLPCYGTDDGAYYGLNLWVAYYNFLRPHELYRWKHPLNEVDMLKNAGNMPGKWQLLIFLGQQVILNMQKNQSS